MFVGIGQASAATGQVSLTNNVNDYTIENDFYKAIIPRNGQKSEGIIRYLYVKKQDGQWSNNIIWESTDSHDYGLGYLEGMGEAISNHSYGFSGPGFGGVTFSILENTSTRIKIKGTKSLFGTDFSETWTFWAGKPYFQGDASAVVTQDSGYLANQFQFAWMINDNLPNLWYRTDEEGTITQVTSIVMQPINSPNLNTYPWINWQFTDENVSMGLIFSDVYNHLGTIGEARTTEYEYQLDFDLGSGVLSSPVDKDGTRSATTIYYTANQATNTDITNFAQNSYQNATPAITQNPIIQSAQYLNNPWNQNPGYGSALLNSPYFLVRQNTQNRNIAIERPQYETSIYAPLYKNQSAIHATSYDFRDQLVYSLNYNNGTATSTYGTITPIATTNSSYETSLQMVATSTDSKLIYNSTFKTWSDSDKLQIVGTVATTSSALVKNIYVDLASKMLTSATTTPISFNANSGTPASSIITSLTNNDSLWTSHNYGGLFKFGNTLIYYDNKETVPALAVPVSSICVSSTCGVTAYVRNSLLGTVTYQYSTDNITWHSFSVVPPSDYGKMVAVDLGIMNISGGVFYIDDDNDASAGIAGWVGWDGITLRPTISNNIANLGSGVYDVQFNDDIYGQLGVAIKVNSPADSSSAIIENWGDNLRIYLYSNTTAQTLTNFSYPFDIEIWPHKEWLSSASDFTALHSQDSATYDKRSLYIPDGIHTGRSNAIYSSGAIVYSTEPYTNSTLVNMTIAPSSGVASTTINTWNTSGDYSKNWTEENTVSADTVIHTIGDLAPSTYYQFSLDSSPNTSVTGDTCNANGSCLSDANGSVTFTYTGGYSTHTFALTKDTTAPSTFSLTAPTDKDSIAKYGTLSWSASSDAESGLAPYELYIDNTLALSTADTSASAPLSVSCGSAHTWYVKALDNNGNSTNSDTRSFTVGCNWSSSGRATIPLPAVIQPTVTPSGLSSAQVSSILAVLASFGADANTIANVQAALSGKTVTATQISTPSFTRNLQLHSTGADVKALQQYLNAQGFIVATTGAGSPGHETTTFGFATYRALVNFQKAHNITPASGYFGPLTRGAIK